MKHMLEIPFALICVAEIKGNFGEVKLFESRVIPLCHPREVPLSTYEHTIEQFNALPHPPPPFHLTGDLSPRFLAGGGAKIHLVYFQYKALKFF